MEFVDDWPTSHEVHKDNVDAVQHFVPAALSQCRMYCRLVLNLEFVTVEVVENLYAQNMLNSAPKR